MKASIILVIIVLGWFFLTNPTLAQVRPTNGISNIRPTRYEALGLRGRNGPDEQRRLAAITVCNRALGPGSQSSCQTALPISRFTGNQFFSNDIFRACLASNCKNTVRPIPRRNDSNSTALEQARSRLLSCCSPDTMGDYREESDHGHNDGPPAITAGPGHNATPPAPARSVDD